jgi:hypothetical protein
VNVARRSVDYISKPIFQSIRPLRRMAEILHFDDVCSSLNEAPQSMSASISTHPHPTIEERNEIVLKLMDENVAKQC